MAFWTALCLASDEIKGSGIQYLSLTLYEAQVLFTKLEVISNSHMVFHQLPCLQPCQASGREAMGRERFLQDFLTHTQILQPRRISPLRKSRATIVKRPQRYPKDGSITVTNALGVFPSTGPSEGLSNAQGVGSNLTTVESAMKIRLLRQTYR